ncbi:hypothetical protein WUBG_09398 [Wuchereria bancrofti]|uniref:Uncharacterized protein n=1 Tax=Wuchereria bancrofti TaxID=6293 RepID=J9EWY4_WUCBA|nr:hypothetical protein WUBG_09398 [Wuchereria bancrofti]
MQPQRRRHNGCTWPPSFLQLLFWVTIPIIASSTAFLLIPLHVLYAPIADRKNILDKLSSCYDKVKSNKNIRSGLSQPVSLTTLSQSPMQFYNEKKAVKKAGPKTRPTSLTGISILEMSNF